jgi:sugar lactone lactonase YvrE
MQNLRSDVVVDGLIYPEGIRWQAGRVWFSDILDRKVLAYDPETRRTEVVVETPDRPSGLGFLPDGRLLIVAMGERKLLRLDPDGLAVAADLSGLALRLNDMVVDGQGRAWLDAALAEDGSNGGLILVEPGGGARVVAEGLREPNGLAVTADGRTLVVNELMGCRIYAFDIGADGSLTNRRVFADLGDASPDGLCLDAEGAAWVGQPFQNRVRRIREGGEVTHEIACGEGRWGIAPVLGGPDRRSLYICTAEVTLDTIVRLLHDGGEARRECRGWIEAVADVDVPGAGWP